MMTAAFFSLFQCTQINGIDYLLADLSVQCGTAEWTRNSGIAGLIIAGYSIGLPLLFLLLMCRARHDLRLPETRLLLSFLYSGYRQGFWWFEFIDFAYKLFLVGLVGFVDVSAQIPAAMVCVGVYVLIILLVSPYASGADDWLQLCVQAVLFIFLLAGHVAMYHPFRQDERDFVSAVFILLAIALLVLFARRGWQVRRQTQRLKAANPVAGAGGMEAEMQPVKARGPNKADDPSRRLSDPAVPAGEDRF